MRTFGISKSYEPPQDGAQHVVISDEIELGIQPNFDNSDTQWQYGLRFEFPDDKTEEGSPKTMWVTVNESLHPKSKLGKIFAACGRLPNTNENVNIIKLHGGNLIALIEHIQKDGKTFAKATSFTKLPPGKKPVEPVLPRGNVPEWLKKKQIAGGEIKAEFKPVTYSNEMEQMKAELTSGSGRLW